MSPACVHNIILSDWQSIGEDKGKKRKKRERKILLVTQSPVDSEMTTNDDNLLNQIIEAENSHDSERLLALVTDDVVIEDVPFVPFGMVMKGKDGVRQGYSVSLKQLMILR
jgi:hypothetical protein